MRAQTRLFALLLPGWMCLAGSGWVVRAQEKAGTDFEGLVKKGFALHQEARFSEAIPVLRQAQRIRPGDSLANLLLGIDLLRSGRAAEAVPCLRTASRSGENAGIALGYLGEANADMGHFADAADAYHAALDKGGSDASDALLAWSGFALERFRALGEMLRGTETGVVTAKRLETAASQPVTSLRCAGTIHPLETRLQQSMDVARNDTAYGLSICYALEAGKAVDRLAQLSGDGAALHRLRGDVLLRLKQDGTGAAEEYRIALGRHAGDPALLARLAEAQMVAGDSEGAWQSVQTALTADPNRREALRTAAAISMSRRDYEKALPALEKLSAQTPGDMTVQVDLARCLAQTGASKEALGHLKTALGARFPDEKGSLHALEARLLRDLGRDTEAAQASSEARRLSDAFQARSKSEGSDAHQ